MASAVSEQKEETATENFKTYFKSQQDQELIRLALLKSPFFSCLDEEQVDVFVSTAELKKYKKGDVIILEGCIDEDEDENDGKEVIIAEKAIIKREGSNEARVQYPGLDDSDLPGIAEADELLGDEEEDFEENSHEIDTDSNFAIENSRAGHDDQDVLHEQLETVVFSSSETTSKVVTENNVQSTSASNDIRDHSWLIERKKLQVEDMETSHDKMPDLRTGQPRSTSCDSSASEAEDYSMRIRMANPTAYPPPPRSGSRRSIYIIRKGNADVWYQPRFSPASLGPGTVFGEGGFLFGRQHSASIVASEDLECWVVDSPTFRQHVLISTKMRQLFDRYATRLDDHNNAYMTFDEFVEAISKEQTQGEIFNAILPDFLTTLRLANTYKIFRFDTWKNPEEPKIYLEDFCFFHLLIARPDPEVDVAFLLMDEKQTGRIFLEDLSNFLKPAFPVLDFNSQFFHQYFGKKGNLSIRQMHFPQFLVDLQKEIGKQAFLRAVEINGNQEGYIKPRDFVQILKTSCGWILPAGLVNRLEYIYCQDGEKRTREDGTNSINQTIVSFEQSENCLGDHFFAYGDFLAFQEVLGNLPFICNLIETAQEMKGGPLSSDDFKVANRVLGLGGRLSRRQVDIVFQIFDRDQDGFISPDDTVQVCGVDYTRRLVPIKDRRDRLTFVTPETLKQLESDKGVDNAPKTEHMTRSILNFAVAALAGAFSVSLVFPLDVVKTRLMNQRLEPGATLLYRSSLDCLKQVYRAEGVAGLYRGLSPQLLGIAPERVIKLQVHDLLRLAFSDSNSNVDTNVANDTEPVLIWHEVLAGGCAGASQLLVTNPMEIAKIRMQLHGEVTATILKKSTKPPNTPPPPPPPRFLEVIKDLGFPGVYRGASSCLLRDVPFSAIYFPAYAICKDAIAEFNSHDRVAAFDIFAAGTVASLPAAFLTAPADVIKTRLQAIPRPGETPYSSIRDCAVKIFQNEGYMAFFQGSLMRTLRIAPQFGLTLWAYESLMNGLGLEKTNRAPTTAPIDPLDYRDAFPDCE